MTDSKSAGPSASPLAPVIVVDSREQTPWRFTLPSVVRGLAIGDYSLIGFETAVAIERKSLDDFVASVTWNRARFWRELERLAAYRLRAVVIEADVADVLAGRFHSKAAPWAVVASALAITTDFGVPVLWAHDAVAAARSAEWVLVRFLKMQSAPKEGASHAA